MSSIHTKIGIIQRLALVSEQGKQICEILHWRKKEAQV